MPMLSTNQQSSTRNLSEQSRKLLAIRDDVFAEWEKRVRSLIPGADEVSHPVLLDTLPLFYGNIAEALSPGYDRENAASDSSAASGHGGERARTTDYQAVEIVYEYQLLRDVLLDVAQEHGIQFTDEERRIIGSSFDQAIRDAIEEFTALQRSFRQRVAASLTHDMRSPLSVIISGAELLLATNPGKGEKIARKILDNGLRLERMFQEQLDALSQTTAQAAPLELAQVDALVLAKKVAEHVNDTTPARCEVSGDCVTGWWNESALRRQADQHGRRPDPRPSDPVGPQLRQPDSRRAPQGHLRIPEPRRAVGQDRLGHRPALRSGSGQAPRRHHRARQFRAGRHHLHPRHSCRWAGV
jgi:signal transduction histidine kinase